MGFDLLYQYFMDWFALPGDIQIFPYVKVLNAKLSNEGIRIEQFYIGQNLGLPGWCKSTHCPTAERWALVKAFPSWFRSPGHYGPERIAI